MVDGENEEKKSSVITEPDQNVAYTSARMIVHEFVRRESWQGSLQSFSDAAL